MPESITTDTVTAHFGILNVPSSESSIGVPSSAVTDTVASLGTPLIVTVAPAAIP